jgi:hypothetical protein
MDLPMPLASKTRYFKTLTGNTCLWLTLAALVGIGAARSSAVLDLTRPAERHEDALGFPGATFGSAMPRPVTLPLDVTLVNAWPVLLASSDTINAEVLVKNVGKESILIPASKEHTGIIKAGNHDQRILGVGLRLLHRGTGKVIEATIGVAFGSADVPDSVITLAPQEVLLIRVAGGLGETWKWETEDTPVGAVEVRAVIRESFLEDDRYVVKNTSVDAVSAKTVQVTWKHN